MSDDELKDEIGKLLRGLRSCDTQATAVSWMARAYKAMECALEHLDRPPVMVERLVQVERLILVPEKPQIQVVQSVSAFDLRQAQEKRARLQAIAHAKTVVYPEIQTHPGLIAQPRAWTRKDTLRLEAASKAGKTAIQRRGR